MMTLIIYFVGAFIGILGIYMSYKALRQKPLTIQGHKRRVKKSSPGGKEATSSAKSKNPNVEYSQTPEAEAATVA